jgi:hypothetical protein
VWHRLPRTVVGVAPHTSPVRDGYGAHVSGGMRVRGGTGEVIVAGHGVETAGWGMIILCAYLCSIISRNGARLGTVCGRDGRWWGGSPACAPERGKGPSAGAGWGTCGCPARAAMTSSGIRRSTSRRTTSGTGPTARGSRPAGRGRHPTAPGSRPAGRGRHPTARGSRPAGRGRQSSATCLVWVAGYGNGDQGPGSGAGARVASLDRAFSASGSPSSSRMVRALCQASRAWAGWAAAWWVSPRRIRVVASP